jgi:hypothetical protein
MKRTRPKNPNNTSNGMMVDENVCDEDVASVAKDRTEANAPVIKTTQSDSNVFIVQISPSLDNSFPIPENIKSGEALVQCKTTWPL